MNIEAKIENLQTKTVAENSYFKLLMKFGTETCKQFSVLRN